MGKLRALLYQGFPSVLYFKGPRDSHKNFLRVQGQISRVLNPEIFLMHIQFKDQNCLNVQCKSFYRIFLRFYYFNKNSSFLFIFLFYYEGPRGLPRFLLGSPRQHFESLGLSILRQGKPCYMYKTVSLSQRFI